MSTADHSALANDERRNLRLRLGTLGEVWITGAKSTTAIRPPDHNLRHSGLDPARPTVASRSKAWWLAKAPLDTAYGLTSARTGKDFASSWALSSDPKAISGLAGIARQLVRLMINPLRAPKRRVSP
jgi:hypothetical protein